MRQGDSRSSETGSIVPIFALTIVVLLIFAALAVDMGAAWAQRRESQTAADAGVMAAALQYLRNAPPDETGIFDLVNDYANSNLTGPDLTFDDWAGCVDAGLPTDYEPLGSGTEAWDYPGGGGSNDVINCISIKKVNNEPSILRVRLPDDQVPTSFARIIGIDEIPVSAFAEAEVRYSESSNIIPFALPADAGVEECMNTPPNGQLPDVTPAGCGSDSGNFGFLDLNWYGSPDPHDTEDQSCGNSPYPNFAARTPLNLALGIDHSLTAWPDSDGTDTDPYPPYVGYDGPLTGTTVPQNDPIVDSCTNAEGGFSLDPYAAGTKTGNAQLLHDGLLGGPFGLNGDPGRLRLDSPSPPFTAEPIISGADLRLNMSNASGTFAVEVDNVGLWEYLDSSNTGECARNKFTGEGRELTDQMQLCLSTASDDPIFVDKIVESPRFAVVPVLNYTDLTGDQNWAIITMRPVYLQTTWYACQSSQSLQDTCLFEPDGFDTYVPPDPPLIVTLTAPNDLSLVSGPTVSIEATASGDNTIVQVEFFVDGKSVGSDTPPATPNYSVEWDLTTPPAQKDGPVTISAIVTDDTGNTAVDSIIVAVNNGGGEPVPTAPANVGKSVFFNPGEGSEEPCLPNKANDDCIKPSTIEADGMTTFVIRPDWLPDTAKGVLGGSSPFEVYLRR